MDQDFLRAKVTLQLRKTNRTNEIINNEYKEITELPQYYFGSFHDERT